MRFLEQIFVFLLILTIAFARPETSADAATEKPHTPLKEKPPFCLDTPFTTGDCTSMTPRYYFDFQTNQCNQFVPCRKKVRTRNNFGSRKECEETCFYGRKEDFVRGRHHQ